jgi:integrase
MRVATARREKYVATLDEIRLALAAVPSVTPIERRNRALIAFTILTGARDGALATFRLKHVNIAEKMVFHDARDARPSPPYFFRSGRSRSQSSRNILPC